jgi:bifunctional pyridoxal-dependent enzyme with beta-cystathionase and maltose regulon repressor activities
MQYWLTLMHWKLRDVESSIWKLDNLILRPSRISSRREFKLSRMSILVRELASQLLEETGIAVLPGTDFGENGEGYLRLCYATAPEDISLAIERIASFLGKLVYSAGAPPTVMKSIIFSKVTGPIPETA